MNLIKILTVLETMTVIYAISIPVSFFICRWFVKHYPDELQQYSGHYEPMYIAKLISFIPVMNSMFIVYTMYYFCKYNLVDRWVDEDD